MITKPELEKLISQLRQQAEEKAENRRIAEFGPAGGNPDAKVEDHIEWDAAEILSKYKDTLHPPLPFPIQAMIKSGKLPMEPDVFFATLAHMNPAGMPEYEDSLHNYCNSLYNTIVKLKEQLDVNVAFVKNINVKKSKPQQHKCDCDKELHPPMVVDSPRETVDTLIELLEGWLDTIQVNIPTEGLCKDKLSLWYLIGGRKREHRYGLHIANNSYSEAALNQIMGIQEATEDALRELDCGFDRTASHNTDEYVCTCGKNHDETKNQ